MKLPSAHTLEQIFREAVAAVSGERVVRGALRVMPRAIVAADVVMDFERTSSVVVVGAGKAAASMARGVEELLGDRITSGLVVTKQGHGCPTSKVCVREASHPLPDDRSERAGREVLRLLGTLDEDDIVIVLLSGGASALLAVPCLGVTLDDMVATTRALLASGATIQEINCVRRHLSAVGGGRLALATKARMLVLVLSDVLGDDLAAIGSGPCAADTSSFQDALAILDRTAARVPSRIRSFLERGALG